MTQIFRPRNRGKFVPGIYGRYAQAHEDPAKQKNLRKSARQSACMRKRPVTLATKPFDHREGDA